MIKKLNGEVWKPLVFSGSKLLRNRYAVSSHGRIASYKDDVIKDGKLLNGSLTTGYKTLNLHRPRAKRHPVHSQGVSQTFYQETLA